MAHVTTMKISAGTRDRLRALGRKDQSLEDVVVAALDVYETQQFWAAAETAAAAESAQEKSARRAVERETDAWMDALR
jgi:hypothetical protein